MRASFWRAGLCWTFAECSGDAAVSKLRKMRTTEDDEDELDPSTPADSARPAWMITLKAHAEDWLKALPETLAAPIVNSSPLSRFFARECSTGSKLLARIRRDLKDLVDVCKGALKQTNELRSLMSDLNKGESRVDHASRPVIRLTLQAISRCTGSSSR